MSRGLLVLAIGLTSLAVSGRAEAVYTRTTVPFEWKWSGTPELNLSTQDDAVSGAINLPFGFPFQDDVFTQIRIHTNGFVTLGNQNVACGNCLALADFQPAGTTNAPDYTIAPWWADWNPLAEGEIWYGAVDDAFVVEWWEVRAYGAAAGQNYQFQLQLYPDGRFRFVYGTVSTGFASRDYGNTASIGYQGRTSAGFGERTLFAQGTGGNLAANTAYQYARASDAVSTAPFNLDANVPDIVERWAPVIWADLNTGQGRCDHLVDPLFDGNWNGADNTYNAAYTSTPMPATVRFSYVEGATHHFIGYYFYHAWDCTDGINQGHEHDWEGVTIAVHKATGALDAALTNSHGMEVPYRSPFDSSIQTRPHHTGASDWPTFTHFTVRNSQGVPYDTLAVGIEAETHTTWGRWHNKCILGTPGTSSGCDEGHGGDGIVYVYGGVADVVGTVPQYPNWYTTAGARVRYKLRPLLELYNYAWQATACGQSQPSALYACQTEGRPWDQMNSQGADKGDLPWVWGEYGTITNACLDRNLMMQPGFIFGRYFTWPPSRLNECEFTTPNAFVQNAMCVTGPQPACTGEIGPVSEESWKQSAVCGPSNTGVTAARCAGSYCDDMFLTCKATPDGFFTDTSAGFWTTYFSEESPSSRYCSPDGSGSGIYGIIDGIRASGSYGDNVSLHCAPAVSGTFSNCQWTGWFSEEQGGVKSFNDKYAVGASCSGSYCDNMNYFVCNLGP